MQKCVIQRAHVGARRQGIPAAVGWPLLIGIVVAIVVGAFFVAWTNERARVRARLAEIAARRAHLLAKYRDEQIVERIMRREIWQGQSQEQLRDSIGSPVDTDENVTRKYRREVWKYHQTGINRFGLRITLENGVVIGWDEKM